MKFRQIKSLVFIRNGEGSKDKSYRKLKSDSFAAVFNTSANSDDSFVNLFDSFANSVDTSANSFDTFANSFDTSSTLFDTFAAVFHIFSE